MNPDSHPSEAEAFESRITALLLGELPPTEATEMLRAIEANPELVALHARMQRTIGIVKEAVASPSGSFQFSVFSGLEAKASEEGFKCSVSSGGMPTVGASLSEERRQLLLRKFRSRSEATGSAQPPQRRALPWYVPMSIAAALMLLLALSELPHLSRAKNRGQVRMAWTDGKSVASKPSFEKDFATAGDRLTDSPTLYLSETRTGLDVIPPAQGTLSLRTATGAKPPTRLQTENRPERAAETRMNLGAQAASPPSTTSSSKPEAVSKNDPVLAKRSGLNPDTKLDGVTTFSIDEQARAIRQEAPVAGDGSPVQTIGPAHRFRDLADRSTALAESLQRSESQDAETRLRRPVTATAPAPAPAPLDLQATLPPLSPPSEAPPPPSRGEPTSENLALYGKIYLPPTPAAMFGDKPGLEMADGRSSVRGLERNDPSATITGLSTTWDAADSNFYHRGFSAAGADRSGVRFNESPTRSIAGGVGADGFAGFGGFGGGIGGGTAATPNFEKQLQQLQRRPETPKSELFWYDVAAPKAWVSAGPNQVVPPGQASAERERTLGLNIVLDQAAPLRDLATININGRVQGPADSKSTSKIMSIGGAAVEFGLVPNSEELAKQTLNLPAGGVRDLAKTAPGLLGADGEIKPPIEADGLSVATKPGADRDVAKKELSESTRRLRESALSSSVEAKVTALSLKDDGAIAPRSAAPAVPQPEVVAADDAFSTFSLNVTDVSFKLAGASLEQGVLPDPASIRSEEFINAFKYRDPEAAPGVPIAFAHERAQYPFAHNRELLRFSIRTAAQGRETGRPLSLVLLLDNSGSMERADRVRILRAALGVLASQLQPQDRISVVTFARTPRLWVDALAGDQAATLAAQVGDLTPEGGTNLEEALNLAYDTAARHFLPQGVNRVVLLTDGAANLGDVDPDSLKQKVESWRQRGVALDCFGIGWEGLNDDLLEVLSRNGDGRYGFVNSPEEASGNFAAQLAGALHVAAADVKVQVEFNPQRVNLWRQIGYAKHQLTQEQFRDNTVDAAELAAAESGNALYVVEVNAGGSGPLATVRARYREPQTGNYREREWPVPYTGQASPLDRAPVALRLAATASAFSEWLARSPFAEEVKPNLLLKYLQGVPEALEPDPTPKKLQWMIQQAQSLSGK